VAVGFGLVMGTLCLVRGQIGARLFVLGLVAFLLALVFSPDASARFLVLTIASLVCAGTFAYNAASSEITGKTLEYRLVGRMFIGTLVRREEFPARFRTATN